MFQLPPALMDGPDSGSTKTNCTVEKIPTEHVWAAVMPEPDEEMNPVELLRLTKRILCCTSCGNLRLQN